MSQRLSGDAGARPRTDYRYFFDSSFEMLCTVSFDGWFKEANQTFLGALGYGEAELLGCPCIDLIHPDDRPATMVEAVGLAEGAEIESFQSRCRHKDGSYRSLSWSVTPDLERDLLYCAVRDETKRREDDAVVEKLLAELERSNTDLAQFAYVASHDLSEPLRMVSSYVQLLADRYTGQLDADADEFIAFAVDGAVRMKLLIDGLLAYSRAGGALKTRRSVDCAALLERALADLDGVVAESGAKVQVDDLPTVIADPGQLAQVFQNLLANALEFGVPDVPAEVRVSAERMGKAWCFSVQDNGIGIAEEHRDRIFLMFKRLHTRSEYPGTGIGLALCHKIVGRFGGRIWVEGALGQGSVFRFTVPDPPAPSPVA